MSTSLCGCFLVAWLSSLIDTTCGWLDGPFDRPTSQQGARCRPLSLRSHAIKVLLASDPTTDLASASMNIHAGHFQVHGLVILTGCMWDDYG